MRDGLAPGALSRVDQGRIGAGKPRWSRARVPRHETERRDAGTKGLRVATRRKVNAFASIVEKK